MLAKDLLPLINKYPEAEIRIKYCEEGGQFTPLVKIRELMLINTNRGICQDIDEYIEECCNYCIKDPKYCNTCNEPPSKDTFKINVIGFELED